MSQFAVATKAVIIDDSHRVLLMIKSNSEDVNPSTIDIPGGRLEFNETPEQGIIREVSEETGLDIKIVAPSRTWILVNKEQDFQLTGITFACRLSDRADVIISDEHTSVKWTVVDDIINGDYPKWLKEEISSALKYFD